MIGDVIFYATISGLIAFCLAGSFGMAFWLIWKFWEEARHGK